MIAAVQPAFRELLRHQVETESRVEVVGDAHDSFTAYSLTRRLKPDILLIECALNRDFSTHYFGARESGAGSATSIVAIVEKSRIQDIVEAFELGARGIVTRPSLPLVWKTGIRSILAGQYWVDDRTVLFLVETIRGFLLRTEAKTLREFRLTVREMEIATKIAAGRSNKEVAQAFSICERTVKHHLTNIFRKVGISSRLELAVLVRENIARQPPVPERMESGQQETDGSGKRHLFAVPNR